MQFYEKLVFVMDLARTSNRELAQALGVDPAVVSRLRNGRRGAPRKEETVRRMAGFLAARCTSDYQRSALSEMAGVKRMLVARPEQLAEFLFYWLRGDEDGVEGFMRDFEALTIEGFASNAAMTPHLIGRKGNLVYYGNEGKRAAVRAAFQHLLSQEDRGTVCIVADESDDWLVEDGDFLLSLQQGMLSCLQRGARICHIVPSLYSGDQLLECLMRWVPLYLTGRVKAYYYPHIRDRLHRHTLAVAPGRIGVTSHSLAGQRSSYATMLTTDPGLLRTFEAEFRDYLSLCRPMLNAYVEPDKLLQCFTYFVSSPGLRIQKLPSLSAATAPVELIDDAVARTEDPELKRLGAAYREEVVRLEQGRDCYDLIDLVRLASVEEVRAGTVPLVSSLGTSEPLCYTPQTYVSHLKNILRILDAHDDYHFVPLDGPLEYEGSLVVKEGRRALLVHAAEPFTVLEIAQPEVVAMYREHLLRVAERAGYGGMHRMKAKSRIRELICALEQ